MNRKTLETLLLPNMSWSNKKERQKRGGEGCSEGSWRDPHEQFVHSPALGPRPANASWYVELHLSSPWHSQTLLKFQNCIEISTDTENTVRRHPQLPPKLLINLLMMIASYSKWTTKSNNLAGKELSPKEPVLCQTMNLFICLGLGSEGPLTPLLMFHCCSNTNTLIARHNFPHLCK